MAGYYTPGLPTPSESNGTFPFTGAEKIALDTELANGQDPQTIAATTAQLLGVLPGAPVNTAFASAVTIDGSNGQVQTIGTLTGAVTVTWANIIPGLTYRIQFVQDGTGTRVATLTGGGNTVKVSGSQSTSAGFTDWLTLFFDRTTYWAIWQTHFA